jgi:mannose-6-phosphate isomerase-like protein (cupin superfamily)
MVAALVTRAQVSAQVMVRAPVTVGARVCTPSAVPPRSLPGDTVRERATIGRHSGFDALEQSLLECASGRSRPRDTGDADEVLFVFEGSGRLHVDGHTYPLEPETGAHLAPGRQYELEIAGPEPLRAVCVRIPAPVQDDGGRASAVVQHLENQSSEAATTGREFRIVADVSTGLRSATHFVGYIPPGRAPDHFHTYDEVIYVLDGHGVLHAGGEEWPIRGGSCIQLPARAVHCLENTGGEQMRVMAVFRPAGSPAAAYYPDGTPAHEAAPLLHTRQNTHGTNRRGGHQQ